MSQASEQDAQMKSDVLTLGAEFIDPQIEETYQCWHRHFQRRSQYVLVCYIGLCLFFIFACRLVLTHFGLSNLGNAHVIPLIMITAVTLFMLWQNSQAWWDPWHGQYWVSLMTYIVAIDITSVQHPPFATTMSLISFRLLMSVCSSRSWRQYCFFTLMDFSVISLLCVWNSVQNFFVESVCSLICLLFMCTFGVYEIERSHRLKFLFQMQLKQSLESERQARFNAERMIGFLSHEVRNPQSAISMSIESVLTDARRHPKQFRADHVRLFEVIRSSSEFVSMLLDDVLNLKRMSEGLLKMDMRPFALHEFIKQLKLSYNPLLSARGVKFYCSLDERVPSVVVGDKHRIRQVISNFVTNAAKFTPINGAVELVMTIVQDEQTDCLPEQRHDKSASTHNHKTSSVNAFKTILPPLLNAHHSVIESCLGKSLNESAAPVSHSSDIPNSTPTDTVPSIFAKSTHSRSPESEDKASNISPSFSANLSPQPSSGSNLLYASSVASTSSSTDSPALSAWSTCSSSSSSSRHSSSNAATPCSTFSSSNPSPASTSSFLIIPTKSPYHPSSSIVSSPSASNCFDSSSPPNPFDGDHLIRRVASSAASSMRHFAASFSPQPSPIPVPYVSSQPVSKVQALRSSDTPNFPSIPVIPRCKSSPLATLPVAPVATTPSDTSPSSLDNRLAENTVLVRFAVRDTGIGISADDLTKLFQPFSQIAAGVQAQKGGGAGLGLNICKGLVELHGGRVGVSSAIGEGTEFWVEIPFAIPSPSEIAQVVAETEDEHQETDHKLASRLGYNNSTLLHQPEVSSSHQHSAGLRRRNRDSSHSQRLDSAALSTHERMYRINASTSSLHSSLDSQSASDNCDVSVNPSSLNERLSNSLKSKSMLTAMDFASTRGGNDSDEILSQGSSRSNASSISSVNLRTEPVIKPSSTVEPKLDLGDHEHKSDDASPSARKRILIVEDSLFIRMLLARILSQNGYQVEMVENGRLALAKLTEDSNFDAIFMDYMMPEMNGVEATRELRRMGIQIPVIGLTGASDGDDFSALIEAGAQTVLLKPVKGEDLTRCLERILHSSNES